MNEEKNNGNRQFVRELAISAILLAICIVSQFFKNLNVYITGPIVNLCLVMAVMAAGLKWGLILAVITPVTAFFIAASPVMQAVPGILPLIMAGNIILVLATWKLFKPAVENGASIISPGSVIAAAVSAILKGAFMGLTISRWLLPAFIPAESPLRGKMAVFQMTFSVTQLITALIGFVYFFIIWIPVRSTLQKDS